MGRARNGLAEAILERLPPSLAFRIDLLRPGLKDGYGGPFNGQLVRQAVVREMFERTSFDLVVETGTYRGTTTAFIRTLTTAPIVTIESDPRLARYARARLSHLGGITVRGGDSATQIRRLVMGRRGLAAERPFFYLDAHGGHAGIQLPLRWEIVEVTSAWPAFCIVIDDFEVPGDGDYGYDGYGPGFRLRPELLEGLHLETVTRFWPAAAGATETGRKRGWLVLARGDGIVAALRSNAGLREEAPT